VPESVHEETDAWLAQWRTAWASSGRHTLSYRRTPDRLFIDDDRGLERRGTYTFHEPLASIYEYCGETMRTARQVSDDLRDSPQHASITVDEVRWALDEFSRRGLTLDEDGRYLSLALPANPGW
jgi:hypothetical protein